MVNHMSTAEPGSMLKMKVNTFPAPEMSATKSSHVAKASHIGETCNENTTD